MILDLADHCCQELLGTTILPLSFCSCRSVLAPYQVADMRNQDMIKQKMQVAYRIGDKKEAERLQALLAPDEDEETQRYKHTLNKETLYFEKRMG